MTTNPTHPLSSRKILIAGAGVSGLTFSISLNKLWSSISSLPPPNITIYERDPEAVPKHRTGYSLSLRSDGPSAGIQTLQKMGILDKMTERSVAAHGSKTEPGEVGSGFCVWKVNEGSVSIDGKAQGEKTWDRVMKVSNGVPEGCPVAGLRIARAELRNTLVEEAQQYKNVEIKWGTTVKSVSSEKGSVQITFSDDKTVNGDFLIAADGSSSKLRSFLRPDDKLQFAGPTCIYALSPIKGLHPSGATGEFGSVMSGAGRALFLAPVDHESMVWCLSWREPSPPAVKRPPLSASDTEELLDIARKQGLELYGQRFENMLQSTDKSSLVQFNALDKQPFPHSPGYLHTSTSKALEGKIVFLGDANHAVSPFAGNGANLALMDAWDLAEILAKTETGSDNGDLEDFLHAALKEYDTRAVGRAKKVVRMSHFSILVMHSQGWMTTFWLFVLSVIQRLFWHQVD